MAHMPRGWNRQKRAASQARAGGGGRGRHGSAPPACRVFSLKALQADPAATASGDSFAAARREDAAELERTADATYYIGRAIRRVSELASSLTRNQMPSNGLGVRISCPPLLKKASGIPQMSQGIWGNLEGIPRHSGAVSSNLDSLRCPMASRACRLLRQGVYCNRCRILQAVFCKMRHSATGLPVPVNCLVSPQLPILTVSRLVRVWHAVCLSLHTTWPASGF